MLGLIGGRVPDPRGSFKCLWCRWLPLPRQLFRLVNLGRGHLFGEHITKLGCLLFAVRYCEVVPLKGLD